MRSLLCASLLLLLSGCGVYTMNPRGSAEYKSIAIEPFENRTTEFGFTDRLTEFVIEAFIKDGSMRVVSSASAEAILVAVLNRYERVPYKFNEQDQVLEYKVLMDFSVALRSPQDQSEFFTEQMHVEGIYDAVLETEEDGQREAGGQLVQAVLNKTTKSW